MSFRTLVALFALVALPFVSACKGGGDDTEDTDVTTDTDTDM